MEGVILILLILYVEVCISTLAQPTGHPTKAPSSRHQTSRPQTPLWAFLLVAIFYCCISFGIPTLYAIWNPPLSKEERENQQRNKKRPVYVVDEDDEVQVSRFAALYNCGPSFLSNIYSAVHGCCTKRAKNENASGIGAPLRDYEMAMEDEMEEPVDREMEKKARTRREKRSLF